MIAPFTGRVREKSVDLGQFVSPGMSLGSIFATDVVEVSLPITDDQLGQLGLPLAFAETATQLGPNVAFYGTVGGAPRHWEGARHADICGCEPADPLDQYYYRT